jgi:hypothetical protein
VGTIGKFLPASSPVIFSRMIWIRDFADVPTYRLCAPTESGTGSLPGHWQST